MRKSNFISKIAATATSPSAKAAVAVMLCAISFQVSLSTFGSMPAAAEDALVDHQDPMARARQDLARGLAQSYQSGGGSKPFDPDETGSIVGAPIAPPKDADRPPDVAAWFDPNPLGLPQAISRPEGRKACEDSPDRVECWKSEPDFPKSVGRGIAAWYELKTRTASGEAFDPNGLTAGHRTLPFGTSVQVVNVRNGRSVVVRINDRGPFTKGRVIDLSRGAARALGISGIDEVILYAVTDTAMRDTRPMRPQANLAGARP